MYAREKPKNKDGAGADLTQKLMVTGFVCPESSCALSIEVWRGMTIQSKEGLEVGKVAAVVLNGEDHKVTHILISRLPEISGYWSIPVDLIEKVRDDGLQLSISNHAVETLPRWHSI